MNKLLRAAEFSHLILEKLIEPGQIFIDATAGNGHDTLFLAERVGINGKVYAFDIQRQAIEKTKKLLEERHCLEWVSLIQDSHENLRDYIKEPINGIIFNLGYLPGGDKSITTSAASTIQSIQQSIDILASGGVVAIVVYPGHSGGDREAFEVEAYLTKLPSPPWYVLSWKRVNGTDKAPYLFLAQKQL